MNVATTTVNTLGAHEIFTPEPKVRSSMDRVTLAMP